jgi:DNA-binding transcriptional ArsR family regulator
VLLNYIFSSLQVPDAAMKIYSGDDQKLEIQSSTATMEDDAKWWETAEDHRFALDVLQLKLRRNILKFISHSLRTEEEICEEFKLKNNQAEYHLALLEKALMIERSLEGYRSTSIGIFFLNNVENKQ